MMDTNNEAAAAARWGEIEMDVVRKTCTDNALLAALSAPERQKLIASCEIQELPKGHHLVRPWQPVPHCFFMLSGIASVTAISPSRRTGEVGIIGCEGFAPTAAALYASTSPFEIFMQVAGEAYAVPIERVWSLMDESPSARRLFGLYVQSFVVQAAYTALANANHRIEVRLARWILMCHDRLDTNRLSLTHEFLSLMLSVRRPSVTTALHVLEGNRLIQSERNLIVVRDREGLETFAADSYGLAEAEYKRLFAPNEDGDASSRSLAASV